MREVGMCTRGGGRVLTIAIGFREEVTKDIQKTKISFAKARVNQVAG